MVNTYPDDATMETKLYEEMRCLRCVAERLLTAIDPKGFIDYQMEKFGKGYKTIGHIDFETNTQVKKEVNGK